jgi:uncharacterized protein DUF6084
MRELVFDCLDVQPDRYAAAPTLNFRLRVSETSGEPLHSLALRCQIRIEPQRRPYAEEEGERLLDLFGERERWGDTLKPLQFGHASTMLQGFAGSIEFDLPVACTYDFEVAASKYFHALDDGEIPLLLLFNGTVFGKGTEGFSVEPVPWHKETSYRLPVGVWRQTMDLFFPSSAWIRMRPETLDALQRFKSVQALPTWDDAFELLLDKAGEVPPSRLPRRPAEGAR